MLTNTQEFLAMLLGFGLVAGTVLFVHLTNGDGSVTAEVSPALVRELPKDAVVINEFSNGSMYGVVIKTGDDRCVATYVHNERDSMRLICTGGFQNAY
jgi:hypothetical protein